MTAFTPGIERAVPHHAVAASGTMALRAGHALMGARQRKPGGAVVIESCGRRKGGSIVTGIAARPPGCAAELVAMGTVVAVGAGRSRNREGQAPEG